MELAFFLSVFLAVLPIANAFDRPYNLSIALSSNDQLTTFKSYLYQFPTLLSQVEAGNLTSITTSLIWRDICVLIELDAVLAPSNEAFVKHFNAMNDTRND